MITLQKGNEYLLPARPTWVASLATDLKHQRKLFHYIYVDEKYIVGTEGHVMMVCPLTGSFNQRASEKMVPQGQGFLFPQTFLTACKKAECGVIHLTGYDSMSNSIHAKLVAQNIRKSPECEVQVLNETYLDWPNAVKIFEGLEKKGSPCVVDSQYLEPLIKTGDYLNFLCSDGTGCLYHGSVKDVAAIPTYNQHYWYGIVMGRNLGHITSDTDMKTTKQFIEKVLSH